MGREEEQERAVRLTDRYGHTLRGSDVTVTRFAELFDALDSSDEEHCSLSVTDSDDWNLAVYPDFLTFENLEGELVGRVTDPTRDDVMAIVQEFISGDFEALRVRGWRK